MLKRLVQVAGSHVRIEEARGRVRETHLLSIVPTDLRLRSLCIVKATRACLCITLTLTEALEPIRIARLNPLFPSEARVPASALRGLRVQGLTVEEIGLRLVVRDSGVLGLRVGLVLEEDFLNINHFEVSFATRRRLEPACAVLFHDHLALFSQKFEILATTTAYGVALLHELRQRGLCWMDQASLDVNLKLVKIFLD